MRTQDRPKIGLHYGSHPIASVVGTFCSLETTLTTTNRTVLSRCSLHAWKPIIVIATKEEICVCNRVTSRTSVTDNKIIYSSSWATPIAVVRNTPTSHTSTTKTSSHFPSSNPPQTARCTLVMPMFTTRSIPWSLDCKKPSLNLPF